MSESWLTPSDITEKLSSVILDRQRGYYRLSDGKAGITLNIPPSVDLPIFIHGNFMGFRSAAGKYADKVEFVRFACGVFAKRRRV